MLYQYSLLKPQFCQERRPFEGRKWLNLILNLALPLVSIMSAPSSWGFRFTFFNWNLSVNSPCKTHVKIGTRLKFLSWKCHGKEQRIRKEEASGLDWAITSCLQGQSCYQQTQWQHPFHAQCEPHLPSEQYSGKTACLHQEFGYKSVNISIHVKDQTVCKEKQRWYFSII